MIIDIRHMEKVKEGTLIYGVIPKLERPAIPHFEVDDIEDTKKKKDDVWKDALKIFYVDDKEIKILHLGEANLTQQENEDEE